MLPILVSIPHACTYIPDSIREKISLSDREIFYEHDLYTDEVYKAKSAYTVKAKISRFISDPNREPEKGLVTLKSVSGKEVYKEPLSKCELEMLKEKHAGYHRKIEELYPKVKFLLDGHSLRSLGLPGKPDAGEKRTDFVLGNYNGKSCPEESTIAISSFLQEKGFKVALNHPYKGRYILERHCVNGPLQGLQLEMNRSLYMDENTLKAKPEEIKKLNMLVCELLAVSYTHLTLPTN